MSNNSIRPELTKDLNVETFRNFYWLGKDLQEFCREHNISAAGPKIEMSHRIEVFLETGEILKPLKKPVRRLEPQVDLSLDTVITENHRCSQVARAFFESVIPKFNFSTYIQEYFKNNVGKTYRDAVVAWNEEATRKKNPLYKTEISPQFEFNQFTRDFFADPENKGKTRKEATAAWMIVRDQPGSNKYTPKKLP